VSTPISVGNGCAATNAAITIAISVTPIHRITKRHLHPTSFAAKILARKFSAQGKVKVGNEAMGIHCDDAGVDAA
jgi:hypothetical protein